MADLVKIENYEGTANTFTFPYNPQSYQETATTFNQSTQVPYSNFHVFIGNDALQPKRINFSGNFATSTKDSDYESITRNLQEGSKLKKLYFRDDRFHIVLGTSFQKTHSNNRTNFLDYVFDALTPIPLAFSSTQKTASYNGSTWDDNTTSNDGGTYTYLEEVTFTLDASASSGDTFTLSSSNDSGITITLTDNYTSGEVFTIKMVRYEKTAGLYQTKY
jgi:hypothetical protein